MKYKKDAKHTGVGAKPKGLAPRILTSARIDEQALANFRNECAKREISLGDLLSEIGLKRPLGW